MLIGSNDRSGKLAMFSQGISTTGYYNRHVNRTRNLTDLSPFSGVARFNSFSQLTMIMFLKITRTRTGQGQGRVKIAVTHLSEEDAVEEVARLCLVLGDVGVGVHAEDLRGRVDGQVLGVLDVALVLKRSTDNRLGPVYTKLPHQRCDDASDTVLLENNGVAPEWMATTFWSDSIVFNEDSIVSIIKALSQH